MRLLSFLGIGALFALGLVIAGMTQPSKIVGFLDVTGRWDPSLALVMGGAVGVHALTYWLVRRRKQPVWAMNFQVPTRKDSDRNLIVGSALFGVGWGLAGYCPGPALSSLAVGEKNTWIFVAAMTVGTLAYSLWTGKISGLIQRARREGDLGEPRVMDLPQRVHE